ncbi:16S rRNA (guanine1207-N2)-methyltransferase [Raineyella antarctica]|uniref:16S rRNA (Guanine1207-N2)-methyltransferase n=1 Tax=Raineyella antarctica TaxID=1577474 RepID=A0A1G6H8C6_9ACTN|nr:methyltransferase [Raineyella antarctica]SDB90520.1 16S rRNA (guanine1207-N2)-methyltransferase [Raineyella antarctica]
MHKLDAVDDLILDEALTVDPAESGDASEEDAFGSGEDTDEAGSGEDLADAPVLVLEAPAVAAELAGQGRTVLHRSDQLEDEADVPAELLESWDDPRLAEVRLVLLRLPANLNALDELAELVATHCHPEVRLVAGARVKHMTRGMNDVLAAHFGEVRASLGVRKCRVLHAAGALPDARGTQPTWPREAALEEFGLTVLSHGATFAGNKLDLGTRLLLGQVADLRPAPGADRAVDLGSGSGILATVLARNGWQVTGVDSSRAAVAATAATAAANRATVEVLRTDALTDWSAADLDLVVCNPPFHVGSAKDSSPAFRMIASAAHALRPGGELWCVYNAHLPYLPALRRDVGPSEVVARDRSYIVTRSTRES